MAYGLLTSHLTRGASTIAIYKDRWAIDSFFKTIKQNLKVKTFVGTNPNAVKTQFWCALLRMNFFIHRDLMAWLHQPFAVPPDPTAAPPQAALALG